MRGRPKKDPEVIDVSLWKLGVGELPEDQPLPRRILPPPVHTLDLIPQHVLIYPINRILRPVHRYPLTPRNFQRCLILSPISDSEREDINTRGGSS